MTRALGADDPQTLAIRSHLAHEMAEQGNHAGAEAEYRALLDAQTRTLGAEHPDALATARALKESCLPRD
jgi:hypothetical protein